MARYVKKDPRQLALGFDSPEPEPADHLDRVSEKIAQHIIEFVQQVASGNGTFHMADLQAYIASQVPETAPDSPSRILRDLRKKGVVDYECIDRKNSLYEVY